MEGAGFFCMFGGGGSSEGRGSFSDNRAQASESASDVEYLHEGVGKSYATTHSVPTLTIFTSTDMQVSLRPAATFSSRGWLSQSPSSLSTHPEFAF